MQRKISKKVSDALMQDEEDRRRRGYYPPPPTQPADSHRHRDPYYSKDSGRQQPTRLAATLNDSTPYTAAQSPYLERNVQPLPVSSSSWDPQEEDVIPTNITSPDNLSEDGSLDEESAPDPPRGHSSNYYANNDPDYDYNLQRRSSSSRDDLGRVKSKKSSKSAPPAKKSSKSRSIGFQDSDNFAPSQSGSSGSSSHRSSSYDTTGRSSRSSGSRRSSQASLGGNGNDGRRSPHSSSSTHRHSSSTRVGSSSRIPRHSSSSNSREVMALPIEIPETVTDADAFRRYLSRSESSMESVGLSGSASPFAKSMNQLQMGQSIHRRTMALSQAIMTLALLSASASQLRFVVAYAHAQNYPALNYFLISTCIIIEILVGIGYVLISRFDFTDDYVEKIHSYLIFGLFMVAVANVIIASFALDDHNSRDPPSNVVRGETYEAVDQSAIQSPT